MDHGVTSGPIKGLTEIQSTIDKIGKNADAIVLHKGLAKKIDVGNSGLFVHLSGNTSLGSDQNLKVQVCSIEEAIRVGGDRVSVHVNIGAKNENIMLEKLGRVADNCDNYGIPLLAMIYPRGPKIKNQYSYELVAHAARVGAELGADIVKTNYTGSIDTFKHVVKGCPVPVIIAGGEKMNTNKDVLQMVWESIQAGGAGASIGRNVFQAKNPTKMVKALSTIIHKKSSVEQALKIIGETF